MKSTALHYEYKYRYRVVTSMKAGKHIPGPHDYGGKVKIRIPGHRNRHRVSGHPFRILERVMAGSGAGLEARKGCSDGI